MILSRFSLQSPTKFYKSSFDIIFYGYVGDERITPIGNESGGYESSFGHVSDFLVVFEVIDKVEILFSRI